MEGSHENIITCALTMQSKENNVYINGNLALKNSGDTHNATKSFTIKCGASIYRILSTDYAW